jgi:hypothetical protein
MPRLLVVLLLLGAVACRKAETPPAVAETTTTVAPAPTATQPAPTPPAPAPAENTTALEPTGAYFAMTELPADFAELDHLLLATIDENAAPAPLNGFLRPKKQEAQDYALVSPAIDGRNLRFTTAPVDGVHYEFSGAFELLDHFAANPPSYETPVLTGTLTKFRGGQQVASTPVQFRYEAGG